MPAYAPARRPVHALLIEDDAAMAEMYGLRLSRDGVDVRIAVDGAKGLATARESWPDIIVLDLRLPVLNGVEVLGRLREKPTVDAPVIILSNYSEPDIREQCFRLGAAEYLVKAESPPATLSRTVHEILRLAT